MADSKPQYPTTELGGENCMTRNVNRRRLVQPRSHMARRQCRARGIHREENTWPLARHKPLDFALPTPRFQMTAKLSWDDCPA